MPKFKQASAETKFLRGETGVDGQATNEERDELEVEAEQTKALALANGTFLGREFLTWLLWRSESSESLHDVDGEQLRVLFTSRLIMRAFTGQVTEMSAKGAVAPYAVLVKQVMAGGLLIQQARIQLTHGERVFLLTLDAENLDIRSAKLPDLLAEEDSERMEERLYLIELMSRCIDALTESFLQLRTSPAWERREVPQIQAWLRGEDTVVPLLKTAGRAKRR